MLPKQKQNQDPLIGYQAALLTLAKETYSDIETAIRHITELDAKTLEVERVSFWTYNDDHTEIICQDLFRLGDNSHAHNIRLKAKEYPRYFEALEESRTIAADDACRDPRTSEFAEGYLRPLHITAMLDVPVRKAGQVVGVVCHEHTGSPRQWSPEEQEFAGSIADMVSVALQSVERQQAEKELAQSLSLLQATLDSTADGLLAVDNEGKIVSFNRKFIEMWQVPASIMVERDDTLALSYAIQQLKDPAGFLKKVRELYGDANAESFDTIELKDGRIFERFSRPQRLDEKSVGRVWSFRDVTARKRAEEELGRYTAELERSNKDLEQFAYVASHDLQEPLRKIITFGSRLMEIESEDLSEKACNYIERMDRAATRMRQLVGDLLEYSRVTSKQIEFEEVDLNKIMQSVLADLEMLIGHTKARIEVAKMPTIKADSHRMHELFQNLLSNALKFRRQEEPPYLRVECDDQEADWVTIAIKDNGIGMESQYLEQIFKPFCRLHPAHEYEGTGIGLALCQQIVRRHGGEIAVSSSLGKGTDFTLRLPRQPMKARS